MAKFELMGKWVSFTHKICKVRMPTNAKDYKVTHPKVSYHGTGMIIGRRWLQDGNVYEEVETGEYGSVLGRWQAWTSSGKPTIPVYLVVENDRKNPIWIDPDGMELLEV